MKNLDVIDQPLYTAVVPVAGSVINDGQWKRFEKSGAPDDLVVTEGWQDESYVATISVTRRSAIKTIADLQKSANVEGVSLVNAPPVTMPQEWLSCVRPAVAGDVKPYPAGSLFIYVMACIDTKTQAYYELAVSWKIIDDRGTRSSPSTPLRLAADQFFSGFRVK